MNEKQFKRIDHKTNRSLSRYKMLVRCIMTEGTFSPKFGSFQTLWNLMYLSDVNRMDIGATNGYRSNDMT